jgi:hypothetical protein
MGISPLPRRVEMGEYVGEVIDEVMVERAYQDGDFAFLIQRIRWGSGDGSETIRFAYYQKTHGTNENQYFFVNRSPSIDPDAVAELIKKAKKKPWFSSLI